MSNLEGSRRFPKEPKSGVSRREAVSMLATGLLAGGIIKGKGWLESPAAIDEQDISEDNAKTILEAAREELDTTLVVLEEIDVSERSEYLDTLKLNTLAFLSNMIGTMALKNALKPYGILIGNRSIPAELKDKIYTDSVNFIGAMLAAGVVAPVIEEIVFRLFPSKGISKSSGINWSAGVETSAIFALVHNFGVRPDTFRLPSGFSQDELGQLANQIKLDFKTDSIPFPQFISGLFYWYLMRTKGIDHAILAHSTQNITAYTLARYFYTGLPLESDTTVVRSDGSPNHDEL